MSEDSRNLLESWSPEDWSRRTGFIAYDASGMAFQLRQHANALHEAEYHFYEFQKVLIPDPSWTNQNGAGVEIGGFSPAVEQALYGLRICKRQIF